MKSEYLLFNFFIFISPFFAKYFYPKAVLPKGIKTVVAILIPAVIFIIWDIFVTGLFWWFNGSYILGIYFIGVPVEELMFFFSVPYACLFIWGNLDIQTSKITKNYNIQIFSAIAIMILGAYFLSINLFYTGVDLLIFGSVLILDIVAGARVIFTRKMVVFSVILLLLITIFNYYLTARPVVIYNLDVKTSFYVLTIPVEDFIYGFSLIILQLIIYVRMPYFYKILFSQTQQQLHK